MKKAREAAQSESSVIYLKATIVCDFVIFTTGEKNVHFFKGGLLLVRQGIFFSRKVKFCNQQFFPLFNMFMYVYMYVCTYIYNIIIIVCGGVIICGGCFSESDDPDPDNLFVDGRFSHTQQLTARLEFVRYSSLPSVCIHVYVRIYVRTYIIYMYMYVHVCI